MKKKVNKMIMHADVIRSLAWKEASFDLLVSSHRHNNEEDFFEAVRWCGKNSGVVRTVPKDELKNFSNWIKEKYDSILNGEFEIRTCTDIPAYNDRQPLSWISKICHILNPWNYPLIYDKNDRQYLRLTNETWHDKLNELSSSTKDYSRYELYLFESNIWAGLIGSDTIQTQKQELFKLVTP